MITNPPPKKDFKAISDIIRGLVSSSYSRNLGLGDKQNKKIILNWIRMLEWLNDWTIEMFSWLNDWMIEWLNDWMIEWLYVLKHLMIEWLNFLIIK